MENEKEIDRQRWKETNRININNNYNTTNTNDNNDTNEIDK